MVSGSIVDDFLCFLHHFLDHGFCIVFSLIWGGGDVIFDDLLMNVLFAHRQCETLFFDDSMVDVHDSTNRKIRLVLRF